VGLLRSASCEERQTCGGIAVKVQVAPGDKWYKEYVRKEEDVDVKLTQWDDQQVSGGCATIGGVAVKVQVAPGDRLFKEG
jgi:hypothetical protein